MGLANWMEQDDNWWLELQRGGPLRPSVCALIRSFGVPPRSRPHLWAIW